MADATVFERLVEPYLLLDSGLAPVAANAAWRARFGSDPKAGDAGADRCLRLDPRHEGLIRSVTSGLGVGQSRLSPVVELDTKTAPESGDFSQRRYWRVFASCLPATSLDPAVVSLRYDDLATHQTERVAQDPYVSRVEPFEQALELAGFGLWTIDVATGRIRCNAQCLRDLEVTDIKEVTSELLLGGSPTDAGQNWDALMKGQPSEYELKVTSSPIPRWVLVRGGAQFSGDGAMRSVIGLTIDITSRKNHELDLDTLAKTERSGRERSEAATRTMDKFIASVSHELRSPLNAIVSWAEVLQLAANPAHVARAGEAIRRNGRQLAHMVDDLLDSGAIATGKLSVNLQPVDLGALAAIVAEDVHKLAQQKGLHLDASDIFPCVVLADASRMEQVVWNLLTNAVKFTDAGVISLSVTAIQDHVELTVRDTGRGIGADAQSMVFERFQQIAPQSSGRVGGLGLGLWLAKHIVSLHGGTIDVASDGPGQGAAFTVTLPLAYPAAG